MALNAIEYSSQYKTSLFLQLHTFGIISRGETQVALRSSFHPLGLLQQLREHRHLLCPEGEEDTDREMADSLDRPIRSLLGAWSLFNSFRPSKGKRLRAGLSFPRIDLPVLGRLENTSSPQVWASHTALVLCSDSSTCRTWHSSWVHCPTLWTNHWLN